VSAHFDCDHHTPGTRMQLRMPAAVRLTAHNSRASPKTAPDNENFMSFLTLPPPFILGIAVLFWADAQHGLNPHRDPPLGKLSKWPWLYPPSALHYTLPANFPNPSPNSAHLWGVHWHCTGWRLVGCTLR